MMDTAGLKELVKFITDTGFLLYFALYSLFRHDRTLKKLTAAIDELRELIDRRV